MDVTVNVSGGGGETPASANWNDVTFIDYDFSACTAIPTLSNTYAFNNIPSDCQMLIPSALYNNWKTATNWATYASKMVSV